ncbi:hypothetical protein MAR_004708, partial [Mya arenaria]
MVHVESWTLDDFLFTQMTRILSYDEGCFYKEILFPGFNKKTHLSEWDLNLICFVLLNACSFPDSIKKAVTTLRSLRTKLLYRMDNKIAEAEFQQDIEMIRSVLFLLFEYIEDETFKAEINHDVHTILERKDDKNVEDMVTDLHKIHEAEKKSRSKLAHLSLDEEQTYKKLIDMGEMCELKATDDEEQTVPKVQETSSVRERHHLKDVSEEVVIEIAMEKCSIAQERKNAICNDLVAIINDRLEDTCNSDLTQEQKERVRGILTDVLGQYGVTEFSASHGCVRIAIEPESLQDLRKLITDCVDTTLMKKLTKIREIFATLSGCEDFYFEIFMCKTDFKECTERLVEAVTACSHENKELFDKLRNTRKDIPQFVVTEVGHTSRNTILLKIKAPTVDAVAKLKQNLPDFTKSLSPLEDAIKDVYTESDVILTASLHEEVDKQQSDQMASTAIPIVARHSGQTMRLTDAQKPIPKLKWLKDIDLKAVNDTKQKSSITGFTLVSKGRLVGADLANECIKLVDIDSGKCIGVPISTPSFAWDAASFGDDLIAVTVPASNKIVVVQVTVNGLKLHDEFDGFEKCRGITYNKGKFYLTFESPHSKVQILDTKWKVLRTVEFYEDGKNIFDNPWFITVDYENEKILILLSDHLEANKPFNLYNEMSVSSVDMFTHCPSRNVDLATLTLMRCPVSTASLSSSSEPSSNRPSASCLYAICQQLSAY